MHHRKWITQSRLFLVLFILFQAFGPVQLLSQHGTSWSNTIVLRDYMKRFVFPEELISYEVQFPGTFTADKLKLTKNGTTIEYQLGEADTDREGNLKKARVYFRTGLDMGETHEFRLEHDPDYTADFEDRVTLQSIDDKNHTAVLYTNVQQIRVPYGEWKPEAPFSEVHAPVLEIAHEPGNWVGPGGLYGDLRVKRISAKPVEDGNLFVKYRIKYWLEGGKEYELWLTARHNDSYITIDEHLKNIQLGDGLSFRFSYSRGVNPDARMAISNSGYQHDPEENRWPWCGYYDKQLNPDGSMPYHLGQWSPHSGSSTHATLFWNDTPEVENAIIFSVYRIEDWKTHQRYVWSSGNAIENLYFYQNKGEKYMETALAGRQRHWALSIFHENEAHPITIESQDGSKRFYWEANRDYEGFTKNRRKQKGGGPEIRLVQKLTDFSLDWVKDLTFVWDEDLDATFADPFHGEGKKVSYEEYIHSGGIAGENNFQLVERTGASYLGGAQTLGRGQPDWFPDYAVSRKDWTPEQRQEVRAILIHWISCLMYHDAIHPHLSMISGHPNFIIETIFGAMYCCIFPNHPDAPEWKKRYLDMWEEYLTIYVRNADEENYALAGRHTESIHCYSRASLRGVVDNMKAFRQYDGTDMTKYPGFRDWIRWHMYALVTSAPWGMENLEATGEVPARHIESAAPWDGKDLHVYTPPQGAHAFGVERPTHSEWHDLYFQLANEIRLFDPELADNFMWALTRGKQGVKPNLESALFTDYGAVLRYDYGGPDEAYLNVQQINSWSGSWDKYRLWGGMNYRWGSRGNGILYYAANDKIWSWNKPEVNGDDFDINQLPVFKVGNYGLLDHETDGILYNFDAVQFYRANGSSEDYHSRDVMMVRDDYVAVYDNVHEGVKGEFIWTNTYWDQPAIHYVNNGKGDNLHVIEPRTKAVYQTEKTGFGTIMRKDGKQEYVFMSDRALSVDRQPVTFRGRSGYASDELLAIFEGYRIRFNDFMLETEGEGFGASACIRADGSIRGRIAGNGSGTIILTLPDTIKAGNRTLYINGEKAAYQSAGRQIKFKCRSSVREGYYTNYDLIGDEGTPRAAPRHPVLSIPVEK